MGRWVKLYPRVLFHFFDYSIARTPEKHGFSLLALPSRGMEFDDIFAVWINTRM